MFNFNIINNTILILTVECNYLNLHYIQIKSNQHQHNQFTHKRYSFKQMLINRKDKEPKDKGKSGKNNKNKNNSKSRSKEKIKSKQKQRSKRMRTFNSSDFQLFQAEDNAQVLFKNDVVNIKIKKNNSQIPIPIQIPIQQNAKVKPQINFNSTINNYTSVYTVISNRQKQKQKIDKAKSQKIFNSNVGKGATNSNNTNLKKKNISTTVNVNSSNPSNNIGINNNGNIELIQKSKSRSKIHKGNQTAKKTKQRLKQKSNNFNNDKLQPYEYIPPSKNSFSSQIVFSTEETRRQLKIIKQQKNLKLNNNKPNFNSNKTVIDSANQEAQNQEDSSILFDTNKILRFSIKQEYKKKNQAAIKIQKVFRGYLTRKILMKYVNNQQQRLGALLGQYKSSSQKNQTHRSNQFFGDNSSRQRQHQRHTQRQPQTSKTFKDANQSLNMSQNMSPTNFKMLSDSSQKQQFGGQSLKRLSESQQQQSEQQNQEQQSSTSQQMQRVYRHQQPIYSHQQISKYLQSSDEQNDFDQYAYQQNIIFQTNEEYLQSRKSSLQNNPQPKNKLSKGLLNVNQLNLAIKNQNESNLTFQNLQNQQRQQQQSEKYCEDQPKIGSIKKRNEAQHQITKMKNFNKQQNIQSIQPKKLDTKNGTNQNDLSKKQQKKLSQDDFSQNQLVKTSKIVNSSNQGSHKASIQQLQNELLSTSLNANSNNSKCNQSSKTNSKSKTNQQQKAISQRQNKKQATHKAVQKQQFDHSSTKKSKKGSKGQTDSNNIDIIDNDNNKTQKKQAHSFRNYSSGNTSQKNRANFQIQRQNLTTINPNDIFSQTISYNSAFKQKYFLPNNYQDYLSMKEENVKQQKNILPQSKYETKDISKRQKITINNVENQKGKKNTQFKKSKIYYFQEDESYKQRNQTEISKEQQKKLQNSNQICSNQQFDQESQKQIRNSQSFHKLKAYEQLQRIKKSQQKKWDQIISLIKSQKKNQISQNKNMIQDKGQNQNQKSNKSQQIQQFMNQILQLSQKNKTLLNFFDNNKNEKSFDEGEQQSCDKNFNTNINKSYIQNKNSQIKDSFCEEQLARIKSTFSNDNKNSEIENKIYQNLSQEQNFNIKQLQELKDSISSFSSSRRGSITEHDITIAKPSSLSRNKLHKQLVKQGSAIDDKNQLKHKQQSEQIKIIKLTKQSKDNSYPFTSNPKNSLTFFKDFNNLQNKNQIVKVDNNSNKSNLLSSAIVQKNSQQKKQFLKTANLNFNDSKSVNFKHFISNHVQNDHIQQMLKLREDLLQKKQCEQLTSLNLKLMKKEISQHQFLNELNKLTNQFKAEKQCIDKTREDITKGYQAAYQLMRQALTDAKRLGYKLPFSKSSQSYKNKNTGKYLDHHNIGLMSLAYNFGDVVVDQVQLNHKKSQIMANSNNKKQQLKISQVKSQKSQNKIGIDNQHMITKNDDHLSSIMEINPNNSSNLSNLSSQNYQNWSSSSENNRSRLMFQIQNISDNQSSSDLEFTQQELIRFRRVQQSYNSQIADLNRNMMIGGDFAKLQNQHQSVDEDLQENEEPKNKRLYRQVYQIQQEEDSNNFSSLRYQQSFSKGKTSTQVQLITERQLQFLIWELSCQILMKPIFSQKFLYKKRQQLFAPKKLSDKSRKDFIQQVWKILPSQVDIQRRLNQNIAPMPKELLKCMRIDFSQYQDDQDQDNLDDEDYEQVGKYEMILDQQICNTAIHNYKLKMKEQKQKLQMEEKLANTLPQIQDFQQQYKNLGEKPLNYLSQRQKFIKSKKQYSEDITWEFTNMELHCIFDSWNEILIQLNTNKVGFSGIGLNQLTLSMIDQNNKIDLQKIPDVAEESKFRLLKILGQEELIICQINQKYKKKLKPFTQTSCSQLSSSQQQIHGVQTQKSQNSKKIIPFNFTKYSWIYKQQQDQDEFIDYCLDGKWIEYSHQALSFFLQIVYLVQQDLFRQMGKQLKKFQLKSGIIPLQSSKI